MRRDDVLIPLYLWGSLSLILHMGFVSGTSAVVARLPTERPALASLRRGPAEASEVEFTFEDPRPPPVVTPPTAPRPPPPPTPERRVERPPPERPRPVRPPEPPPPPTPATPARVTPPPRLNAHFIDQDHHAEEPTPTDPHYLAPTNRNVEDETIAALRSLDRDHANPRVGASPSREPSTNPGNASREVHADAREVAGRRDRVPNESPESRPPERPNPRTSASAQRPTAGGDGRRAGNERPAGTVPTPGGVAPTPNRESGDPIASASSPQATPGEGGEGGAAGQGGRSAAEVLGVRGMGPAGTLRALMPRYDNFVAVFGREAIQRQREEAAQRRSEARGSTSDDWAVTRAALENFVSNVRVGNQTALRAAASPFAGYIVAMHNRIHRLFADGYLAGLTSLSATSPLNDRSLHTTLEIIVDRDGSVHRINIVRSSGTLPFDVAAMNAVRRAAPFGEAPPAILSGDGKVYVHWGFYRNERQCGPFNAEPFILPNPQNPAPRRTPRDQSPAVNPGNVGERERGPAGLRAS